MTVKDLLHATGSKVYIADGDSRFPITQWSLLHDTFKDCIIDNIEALSEGELEITLKTQLVRKMG